MKVLLSAYLCEPEKGSELAVGWNWVLQIARFHDVWVLTAGEWRKGIQNALAKDALHRVRFGVLRSSASGHCFGGGQMGTGGPLLPLANRRLLRGPQVAPQSQLRPYSSCHAG